jgi:spore coat polysaccharide biosynthesis protein SpsF
MYFLIQARMNSSRLPGKIFKEIFPGKKMIDVVYERVLLSQYADRSKVIILTTTNPIDDVLCKYLASKRMLFFRGSENGVFERFHAYLSSVMPAGDYFFRICPDNPFIEPKFINAQVEFIKKHYPQQFDYISYYSRSGKPAILTHYGLFCEMVRTQTFIDAQTQVKDLLSSEHVTPFLYTSDKYKQGRLEIPYEIEILPMRLTVDTMQDLEVIKQIASLLHNKVSAHYDEIISAISKRETILENMIHSAEENIKT